MSRNVLGVLLTVLGVSVLFTGCIPQPPDPGPEPSFTASPTSGKAPLFVQFSDTSTGANPVLNWSWDFGDGNKSNLPNPTHTYYQAGKYTVTLTVTNGDGSKTTTRQDLITVTEAATFQPIPPTGGTVTVGGVTITLPPLVNDFEDVYFGISESTDQAPLNPSESIVAISPTYRVRHNGIDEDFYLQNEGELIPSVIRIAFTPEGIPALDINRNKIQILVRLADNFNIPILGFIFENTIIAPVLRFPADATYTVIYRPEASIINLRASNTKEATSFEWPKDWEISISDPLLRELAALDIGTLGSPTSYDRRDFNNAELGASLENLKAAISAVHTAMRGQGARSPLLTQQSNILLPGAPRFTLLLYDAADSYPLDFGDFRNLRVSTHYFGQVVVDPRQLLTVTKSNALTVLEDPSHEDLNQEYTFANAFAQELFDAVFEGYGYPQFPVADLPPFFKQGGEREDFLAGLRDGIATYLGQTLGGVEQARAFADNEFATLSQPLLLPEREGVPGYSVASQEFFFYLDKAFPTTPRYAGIFSDIVPTFGILEELRITLDAEDINPIFFNDYVLYQAATLFMREAVDDALQNRVGVSLSEAYLNYILARGIQNGATAMLRPSDAARMPLTFNRDRFEQGAVVEVTMSAPTDSVFISAENNAALDEIPPLTSRALVLNVYPFASELTLVFNRADWEADGDGNGIEVAVFEKGKPGVLLGPNDTTVTLTGIDSDPDGCLKEVVVLLINTSKSTTNSVDVTADSIAALDIDESQVLDLYVRSCDPNIKYTSSGTVNNAQFGVRVTTLTLDSGAWRSPIDANHTNWTHTLALIEPTVRTSNKALLLIDGGSTGAALNNAAVGFAAPFALATGSTVAVLRSVPNQPIRFTGTAQNRSEDALIAWSYDKYMDGFAEGKADMSWPALLPMTRAAVAAMDAVQDFVAQRGTGPAVDSFVVTGASKRGWTTWLTAATDTRVAAIMPIVIDVLNMDEQMDHHFSAYGFYSSAIQPYVDLDIFGRFGLPEGDSLLKIVDPFEYLNRLTMPKFIMNATGDQFFLPDSSQFYWDMLPGSNHLNYTPNVDHGLTSGSSLDTATLGALLAYYTAHVNNVPIPSYDWSISPDNRITVTTAVQPSSVLLWQATNPTARDFRLETIGATWSPTPLVPEDGSSFTYVGEVEVPVQGWRAFYVQLIWPGPDTGALGEETNFIFSTQVKVVPDILPFGN